MESKNEYLRLVAQANYHSKKYYDEDAPELTDYEYDLLTQRIKRLEAEHPDWVVETSPTQRVGGTASATDMAKLPHRVRLLSLNDVFSHAEVENWFNGVGKPPCVVEEKIDGLSMAVKYVGDANTHGVPTMRLALTRGDGSVGENVTPNAMQICGIPASLPKLPGLADDFNELIVRVEVYQPVAEFERVNREMEAAGKKLFANPRNCAAGSLRTKDPRVTKSRGLYAIAFSVLHASGWENIAHHMAPMKSQFGDIQLLGALGFTPVKQHTALNINDIFTAIDFIGRRRVGLPYWTDGAVVKVDSRELQNQLGTTSKYPLHAVAYKYPAEKKVTIVRDIAVQTGRTGVLTPVAIFDPVQLGGTTVTRATLHNQKFIDENNVGIGAEIEVLKSGEIIPKVVGVPKPAESVFKIDVCPICGTTAVLFSDENGTDNGVYGCPNIACPAQKARYIEFFCSKEVMDISGMGPAMVDKLIDLGFINDAPDIYHLGQHKEKIAALDGLGEKSVTTLLKAIEASKTQDIDRVIKALGIPGIGRYAGKALAARYPDMDTILALSEEELQSIDGIGEITARDLYAFGHSEEGQARYKALVAAGVNNKSLSFGKASDGSLRGLTFVITGSLPTMGRDEAKALIEANGGKCSGSVSKKTSYLLAGEAAGSKLTRANELGIKVISENDLKLMLQN